MRAALLLLLTGCDAVFGVQHEPAPADAVADSTTDAPRDVMATPACSDPDLELCLTFDEARTDQARDGTTNQNHASLENVSVTERSGSPALEVGAPSSASITNDQGLDINGELTLALWVRIDAREPAPAFEVLFDNHNQYAMVLRAGNMVGCSVSTSSGGRGVEVPIATGWHHVACVRTAAALTVHIDALPSGTIPVGEPTTTGDPVAIQIGQDADPDGAMAPFTGAIDEVRVYARALAQAELMMLAD